MSVEDSLRTAVEEARAGRDGLLEYGFNTSEGEVAVLADVVLENDTIICRNLCIYAASDPPGIKKSTIARELLSELRALLKAGNVLGYEAMTVQGKRTAGSSSANVGKIVDIRRRRKK
ncbi:hypothetical protein [Duganella sp. HH101]|uniref:hypothetical protein n=1 Tax=Duganella sp. HH101 TaxID=1781066 RepID=UPI00114CDEC6|nr:hypothetical protein [Duganella sp. HH101]